MQRGIFILRRTGRVIIVFFLVFFCMAGLWLFQSFRESRVVKTKKEYRNVYITDVKQQKVEGIWRGQKKTWQLRSAVSIRKSISCRYNYTTKLNTGNILRTKISLPCKDGLVDTDFIRKIMTEEQKRSAGLVLDYLRSFSEQ